MDRRKVIKLGGLVITGSGAGILTVANTINSGQKLHEEYQKQDFKDAGSDWPYTSVMSHVN